MASIHDSVAATAALPNHLDYQGLLTSALDVSIQLEILLGKVAKGVAHCLPPLTLHVVRVLDVTFAV